MTSGKIALSILASVAVWIVSSVVVLPATAQIAPTQSDPLARMRAKAAEANIQVCSVSETSACAQANPKIISSALETTVLADNLRRLNEIGARVTGTPAMDRAAAWAEAAFRDAGVDSVTTEESSGDTSGAGAKQQDVVAQIRGRERPDEFVMLGANLDSGSPGMPDNGCNAAVVVEAARDIHLTGLRPRRSIRFVLFSGREQGMLGSWVYVRAHADELDRAIASVILEGGCGRVTGFSLGGRHDIEPGVRESLEPLASWGVGANTYDAPFGADNLDFLLQGVPNLLSNRAEESTGGGADWDALKHAAGVAGVLAFALAEHPAPLGPRLSRAEIESLLNDTGLGAQLKAKNLWPSWESGRRGRQP